MTDPTAVPPRVCTFDGCNRTIRYTYVGLCDPHYRQFRTRGRSMTALTPLKSADAELDVHDYLFLTITCGMPPDVVLARMHMSSKTMIRRFQNLRRPVPNELWSV